MCNHVTRSELHAGSGQLSPAALAVLAGAPDGSTMPLPLRQALESESHSQRYPLQLRGKKVF